MTPEQLKRANEISQRLEALDQERKIWEHAKTSGYFKIYSSPNSGYSEVNIPNEDLTILRAIRLQKIQSEINLLTQEFEKL